MSAARIGRSPCGSADRRRAFKADPDRGGLSNPPPPVRCSGGPKLSPRGAPGETRTHDLQLRRLTLYPTELRARGGAKRGGTYPSPGPGRKPGRFARRPRADRLPAGRIRGAGMRIAEMVVSGVVARALMDLWQRLLKAVAGVPTSDWGLVGRWFGHAFRGKFFHDPIAKAAPVPNELAIGWIGHYATGIVYGFVYVPLMRAFGLEPCIATG